MVRPEKIGVIYILYHGVWGDQRLATVLQIGCYCNTVMGLIKNSASPLIDQRPKACWATHSVKKDFHTTKQVERFAMLILQAPED